MENWLNEQYIALSKLNKEYLRDGLLDAYADNLRKMAKILHAECKRKDEIKCLLISFYIDLSGWNGESRINWETVESIFQYVRPDDKDMSFIKVVYDANIKEDILPAEATIIDSEEAFDMLKNCIRILFKYCRKNNLT